MLKKNKIKKVSLNKQTIKYYWQEVKKHKISFFVMAICIPGAAIMLDTVIPYQISLAVGELNGGSFQSFLSYLHPVALFIAIGVALNLAGYQFAIIHESAVRGEIVHSSMSRLLKKDQGFFSNQKIGALTGKFIDFINSHIALQDLLIMKIIIFTINIAIGLILIFRQTPTLAGIILALTVALLIQVKISKYLRRNLRKQRKDLVAEANGLAADMISNNITVKTFAAENEEIIALDEINERYKNVYRKDLRLQSVEGSTRILVTQIVQVASIFLIGSMLFQGQIELSIALFTIIYLQKFSTRLFELGDILFGYEKIMLQATPMTEILVEPIELVDKSDKKLDVSHGKIEFRDLNYSYQDSEMVLKNLSITIPAGQKVGLVGHSGAGKTTLTKLLLRFDDLNEGSILIDGQDIGEVTQESLRRAISYVPQEPMLFHRSLRDNIAYGDPGAKDSDIIEAAKLANAYEFIECLPQGLDTIVGERGVKLSGGQRQRIAIARAILKDAPILILDEATSALDSESELLIQKSMKNLMKNRTSLVIAHRLSTISKLDRIIVLDKGRVIEDGTHQELLAKNGKYSVLWKHQSGGFIDEG